MSKSTVVKLFVGGVVSIVAGAILGFATIWVAYANGAFVMNGPDVTGLQPGAFAWSAVGIFVMAIIAVIGGFVVGLVSWIGALLNTAELEDKSWFLLLLVLGLLSFGIVAMIAYVVAGPDGRRMAAGRPAHRPA